MNAVLTVSPLFKYSIGLIQYTYILLTTEIKRVLFEEREIIKEGEVERKRE